MTDDRNLEEEREAGRSCARLEPSAVGAWASPRIPPGGLFEGRPPSPPVAVEREAREALASVAAGRIEPDAHDPERVASTLAQHARRLRDLGALVDALVAVARRALSDDDMVRQAARSALVGSADDSATLIPATVRAAATAADSIHEAERKLLGLDRRQGQPRGAVQSLEQRLAALDDEAATATGPTASTSPSTASPARPPAAPKPRRRPTAKPAPTQPAEPAPPAAPRRLTIFG